MRTKNNLWITGAIVLAVVVAISSLHWGRGISGKVIDAESGRPLAGVVVVADWILMGGLHRDQIGSAHVAEVVTNSNGRFQFSAWGPTFRLFGSVDRTGPWLYLLKVGYLPTFGNNGTDWTGAPRHGPEWKGDDIAMKQIGNLAEVDLQFLTTAIEPMERAGDLCSWEKIPHYTAVVVELEAMLEKETRLGGWMPDVSTLSGGKCDDLQTLLRE